MRGQPWLRLLLIVAVFAAMGVPVWRLTRPAAAATASAEPPSDATPAPSSIPLEIEVAFAGPPPAGFQLKHLGQTLLQGGGGGAVPTYRAPWAARLPKEGADLTFEAQWPPDAPAAAARVSVSFPDGRKVEKTFWARGGSSLVEILTVPAAPGEPPPS